MGRIRPGFVKRQADQLMAANKETFTVKFDENKKALEPLAEFPTKKLRNLIAGHITKKLKAQAVQ